MHGVEMVRLVNGKCLARGDAGAHAIGSRTRLVPVGAHVETGCPQIVGGCLVADVIDRDALIVAATEYSLGPAIEVTNLGESGSIDDWAKDVPRVLIDEEELTAFQFEVILESRRRPELKGAVRDLYAGFRKAMLADLRAHGVEADKALATLVFAALDGLIFEGLALNEPQTTRAAIRRLRELLKSAQLTD